MPASPLQTIVDNSHIAASPTEPHLKVAQTMTGGFLVEYFRDRDQQATIGMLADRLFGLTIQERDRGLRDYKDANKIPSPNKPGKEVIDPVASVRASEIKAIWAALNVTYVPQEELRSMGYHPAVALARQSLKDAGLDADGEVKRDPEERKAEKKAKLGAQAAAQVLMSTEQEEGESDTDYAVRVQQEGRKAATEATIEADTKAAEAIAVKLIAKLTPQQCAVVVYMLQDHVMSLSVETE
jgi:hypothetical protein